MENGGGETKQLESVSSSKTENTSNDKPPVPVHSREVTLKAHFTFGTSSMAPVQYAHVTPTSTSALSGRPLMASGVPAENWRWNGDGAQCSITCGREGLTMTYNAAQPTNYAGSLPTIPCTICDSMVVGHKDHFSAITTTTTSTLSPSNVVSLPINTCLTSSPSSPTFTQSLVDLSKPQGEPATRSLTFSGSLDRATQRTVQQRPYNRRCKSTAHIILQNNGHPVSKEGRPHEFHSTIRDGPPRPPDIERPASSEPRAEPRGRARHRVEPDQRFFGAGAFPSNVWERLHPVTEEREHTRRSAFEPVPPILPPCCSCHHCTALYSFMSSLAHERTCHICAHHNHHPHRHSCSQSHSHTHPNECQASQSAKSPTTQTFNSHKSYEQDIGAPKQKGHRQSAFHGPPYRPHPHPCDNKHTKVRTPSPGVKPRRPPSPESDESTPSPDRLRRGGKPEPNDRQPLTRPQLPRRVPRMGAAAAAAASAAGPSMAAQGDGGPSRGSREQSNRSSKQRPRPRTIHIDVYCSSSSELETTPPTSPISVSEESLEMGHRRPHAVVALGSKQRKKTELNLGRSHYRPLEEKASSFVYSHGRRRRSHSGGKSTFITDNISHLSASPPPSHQLADKNEEAQIPEPIESQDSTYMLNTDPGVRSPIPMPAPPEKRPTSFAVPLQVHTHPTENVSTQPQGRHSSLSYHSSPVDIVDPWGDGEPELPSSVLSWRGSEFETSTPRLTSEMDLPSPRPTSDLSLLSLHEAFYEAEPGVSEVQNNYEIRNSPKDWRSPQLERQKYIQKGQEQRYKDALKRRAMREGDRSETSTPTNVAELAKLPAFRDFSKEDLKVISKSLDRRESLQSTGKQSPVSNSEGYSQFADVTDSNRLLQWMQQYKAQELTGSLKSDRKDSESLGYAESGSLGYAESAKSLDRTDSFASLDSRESFGTIERKKPFSGLNDLSKIQEPSKGKGLIQSMDLRELKEFIERGESSRSLERKDSAHSTGFDSSHLDNRRSCGIIERKSSFKVYDKNEYYRALQRTDSGKGSQKNIERDKGRLVDRKSSTKSLDNTGSKIPIEKSDEKRPLERSVSERYVERRQPSFIERSDSCDSSIPVRKSDSYKHLERKSSNASSHSSVEKKYSSFLEELLDKEESSRSDSVEWQDVISTVRRRLSACAQKSSDKEKVQSPTMETKSFEVQTSEQTQTLSARDVVPPKPLQSPRKLSMQEDDRELPFRTVGGRMINVGLFRHLPRFPFSQTVPVPASRFMDVRTAVRPEQRKFVRPQIFGAAVIPNIRRGIHFGPPKNPQCSCENCTGLSPVPFDSLRNNNHLRAWSMGDLGTEDRDECLVVSQQPSSLPGASVCLTDNIVTDSTTLSHVGAATAGGE